MKDMGDTTGRIMARFHAQQDIAGSCYEVDPLDEMESFDYSSDVLTDVPTAPAWVRSWEGPFGVEILDHPE